MNESTHITSGWFEHVRTIRSPSVGFNIFTNQKFVKLQRQIRESSSVFAVFAEKSPYYRKPGERFALCFFTTADLSSGVSNWAYRLTI